VSEEVNRKCPPLYNFQPLHALTLSATIHIVTDRQTDDSTVPITLRIAVRSAKMNAVRRLAYFFQWGQRIYRRVWDPCIKHSVWERCVNKVNWLMLLSTTPYVGGRGVKARRWGASLGYRIRMAAMTSFRPSLLYMPQRRRLPASPPRAHLQFLIYSSLYLCITTYVAMKERRWRASPSFLPLFIFPCNLLFSPSPFHVYCSKITLILQVLLLHPVIRRMLFTARCTIVQSAVLRSHVVRLSVCDVGESESGPHRLEILETNFTDN